MLDSGQLERLRGLPTTPHEPDQHDQSRANVQHSLDVQQSAQPDRLDQGAGSKRAHGGEQGHPRDPVLSTRPARSGVVAPWITESSPAPATPVAIRGATSCAISSTNE